MSSARERCAASFPRVKPRQEPVIFGPHQLITFASAALQARSVENYETTAFKVDDPFHLQIEGRRAHCSSLHPQHVGDELLCHRPLFACKAVQGHQHPASKSLAERVMQVADGALGNWFDETVTVSMTRQAVKDAPPYDPRRPP
jgi:hypothetical protein